MMGYFNNMMGAGWGTGFGFFGFFFMIVFWVLVIWAVFAFLRCVSGGSCFWHSHGEHKYGEKEKTPLDILKERYAKGEINKKEFDEKKKDLA